MLGTATQSAVGSLTASPPADGAIDDGYKRRFEHNVSVVSKLDHEATASHQLRVLKFDEVHLSNTILRQTDITNNYIERVVAEDISSRNNKISDTNKNKELHYLDPTKPLHHNTIRGKEYRWGSTREINKVESKSRKRRPNIAASATAYGGAGAAAAAAAAAAAGFTSSPSKRARPLLAPSPKRRKTSPEYHLEDFDDDDELLDTNGDATLEEKQVMKQYDAIYISIWKDMSRKDGPKVSRMLSQATQARMINMKKTAILAAREAKRWQLRNNKGAKDLTTKSRRAMREMFNFWKRNERVEREQKKRLERDVLDKAKREEEEREAKRQSRKLNFLITQTELYSHFIGNKIKTAELEGGDAGELAAATDLEAYKGRESGPVDFDNDDDQALQDAAAANAASALEHTQARAKEFNGDEMNFQNPQLMGDMSIKQPEMLKCTLKEYQIKGLNWLANLYEQGINGILADEMGLGKTVQSISVLAYLAEVHNIWGPFLVVTPASTLHNWQQEITKFVPQFKVLPYWGSAKDRKVLRKFWDRKSLRYDKDAPFHVLVTSYQLVVADAAYFQKMKWQYMILDEAQAIKSSQSSRWKTLLSFSCRNRLLLTGTPIQNSMQELWALLHFIMPSIFDSHDEFSDWFSKDIESHAQGANANLDEQQLRRLHVILKPFMLRRIKKNVQSELGDKKEIDVYCELTNRQKKYYQMLRSQISVMDLLDPKASGDSNSLINLVMQFRKVCNHPDLFERADVESPLAMARFAETGSFLRESDLEMSYSSESEIVYPLPRLVYDDPVTSPKGTVWHPSNRVADGFLRLADVSGSELEHAATANVLERAVALHRYNDSNYNRYQRQRYLYDRDFAPSRSMLHIVDRVAQTSPAVTNSSGALAELYNVAQTVYDRDYLNVMGPAAKPAVWAPPVQVVCSRRRFENQWHDTLFNPVLRQALAPLPLDDEYRLMAAHTPMDAYPASNMAPGPLNKFMDPSYIRMPSMTRFITESGKLATLDKLLVDLKRDGHRVLVYFQMTRMMDLMEEYLTYRQHKYIRLDGSSKLDDRRDLVHDWQTKPEIFVFLLSTRAGGLGINLTAADTVIFYDSDWNPTIDSQAMDRAHRLGQTKQVTVYRLLMKDTIEERMRDRAKQKEQVQQVVMEGKAPLKSAAAKRDDDKAKKKDVAFLLLGDDVEVSSGTATPSRALEDMYHEGEGRFSSNGTPVP
ncbi:chromatin-remodeling ATPase Ino80p [Diutina catenulata]